MSPSGHGLPRSSTIAAGRRRRTSECRTAAESAAHLSRLLARELEGGCDDWERDSLRQAIADVEAYAEALGRPGEGALVEERHPVPRDSTAPGSRPGQVAMTCLRTSAVPDRAMAHTLGRTPHR